MKNIKAALVGGLLGVLSTLGGLKAAHAECDYPERPATAYEAEQGMPACEIYELAFSLAEESCDMASQGWLEEGLTENQVGGFSGMYEACMRLSVPPMVLSPAQHYDTTDGAFWRTVD